MAGQCPQPRGDGTARHALSRRPRLRSSQARRRRSIAAARYLFAVASGMEIRMTSSPSPRRWLFVLTILVGSFLLFLVQPMVRSEEHTSELQSLMRISYAVFCLKKKNNSQYLT